MFQPSSLPQTGAGLHANPRPRLVYLPGIDGTGRLLYRQPALLERYDVRCVSYAQDRAGTYEDLVALGEAELEPAGGDVLAESFGGAPALLLALRRPDLVKRLLLVNTFAHFPRQPLIALLAFLGKYLPRRPGSVWTRGLRGRFFFPPDIPIAEHAAWWDRTADVPLWAYGQRLALIAKLDLRPRLREIAVPTTVFVSPNDRVVPPPAGRLLAKRLPNARLVELPAGHAALIHPKVDAARLLELAGRR
jgi:pimeloyl-ACP methyl ester carboxylesterase